MVKWWHFVSNGIGDCLSKVYIKGGYTRLLWQGWRGKWGMGYKSAAFLIGIDCASAGLHDKSIHVCARGERNVIVQANMTPPHEWGVEGGFA